MATPLSPMLKARPIAPQRVTRPRPAAGCAGLGLAALAALVTTLASAASSLDVGPNTSAVYAKECGSCHFPYQPGFLPERSWRQLMAGLGSHFGENAEIKTQQRDTVLAYLVGAAADKADNQRSRDIMATLQAAETPLKVTSVLYVGGIHGGFLDPKFLGKPAVKTLADCAACHPRAEAGRFTPRNYIVSDELFRVLSGD